jgi:hypothetical protein
MLQSCISRPRHKGGYQNYLNWIVEDAVNRPETVIRAILNLDNPISPGSCCVFFIKPMKENGVFHRNIFTVFVPSGLVEQLVMALGCCQAAKKIEFFRTLSVDFKTSSAGGWIFEQVVHEFLIRTKSVTILWFDEEQSSQTLEHPSLDMRTMDTDLHPPPFFYWRTGDQN